MLKIILSQSFECLAKLLAIALEERDFKFKIVTIFVPSVSIKQSLMVALAKQSSFRVIAGCKISTLDEFFHLHFPQIPTKLELRCLLYDALAQEKDAKLEEFLQNDSKKLTELSETLSTIFFSYGRDEIPAFNQVLHPSSYWQNHIFAKIFLESSFRLPLQIVKDAKFFDETVYFFGFSHLPKAYLEFLQQQKNAIYFGFCPTLHFWQDSLSVKEASYFLRKALNSGVCFAEIQKAQEIISSSPPMLSSLGKLGRDFFDSLEGDLCDVEMAFEKVSIQTLLGVLQTSIITYEKHDFSKIHGDDSIKILKSGSTKLQEILSLKQEISTLCLDHGLKYSDILVLAPNMQEYLQHVRFIFSLDEIPFRFLHIPLERQSHFYQAMEIFVNMIEEPIGSFDLVSLLQKPSFFNKLKLSLDDVEKCSIWVEKIFQKSSDFQEGVSQFYLQSLQMHEELSIQGESIQISPGCKIDLAPSDLDLFEKFIGSMIDLMERIQDVKNRLFSLSFWADFWEKLASDFLEVLEEPLEKEAFSAFEGSLKNMRSSSIKLPLFQAPFDVIKKTLLQGVKSDLHSSMLHAVTFGSIQEGSIESKRCIYFLGMDEESFPKKASKSSLDFSQNFARQTNLDRYLFLQAVLNAKEFLRISYSHIHPQDGKKVTHSIVVEELLSAISHKQAEEVFVNRFVKPKQLEKFRFEIVKEQTKEDPNVLVRKISLKDLSAFAKNPWKFFLKQKHRILIDEDQILPFATSASFLTRLSLYWPAERVLKNNKPYFPSSIDEAFSSYYLHKSSCLQKVLETWDQKLQPISLLQTVLNPKIFQDSILELPSIHLKLDSGYQIEIMGDISTALTDGYLHLGDDAIGSVLRSWPEALATLVALKKNQIFFAKNQKIKVVENPEQALKEFVSYYLLFENSLSPLHPLWANAFLRGKLEELSYDLEFRDASDEWILMRLEKQLPETIIETWSWIKKYFLELVALYPMTKGSYEEV